MDSFNLAETTTRWDEWQHIQVLDRDQLDRSTDCDLIFANQVLDAYFHSIPASLKAITDAIRNRDSKALRYQAHLVKSSSQAIGAKKMAEICWILEVESNFEEAEILARHLNFGFCEVRALANRLGLWLEPAT